MPRNSAPPRFSQAGASRVKTTHTKSIYAADLGAPRPLSAAHRGRVVRNDRAIHVGHAEQTPHGTLRCERRREDVVVFLQKDGRRVGRTLMLFGAAGEGPFPESAFSVEVDEFIGTPWHELEYTSLWTVHGLRSRGEMEATVER